MTDNQPRVSCLSGCRVATAGDMGAADVACPHHGASLLDADANMNCTRRRPEEVRSNGVTARTGTKVDYVSRWRWPDLAVQLFIHIGCLYGFYLIFTSVKLLTAIWGKSRSRSVISTIPHQISFVAVKPRKMRWAGHIARMG